MKQDKTESVKKKNISECARAVLLAQCPCPSADRSVLMQQMLLYTLQQ